MHSTFGNSHLIASDRALESDRPFEIILPLATTQAIKSFAEVHDTSLLTVLLTTLSIQIARYTFDEESPVKLTCRFGNKSEWSGSDSIAIDIALTSLTTGSSLLNFVTSELRSKASDLGDIHAGTPQMALSCDATDLECIRLHFTLPLRSPFQNIEGITEHFTSLLEQLLQNPEASIRTMPFLKAKELKILHQFSSTEFDPLPANQCLHRIFEATAQAYPQNLALRCAGNELTYLELNAKANGLARLLIEKGVKPGNTVGILLPRSLEVFVAILAVLKSGAAYVPIDPRAPADRIEFILSDSNVTLVLTDEATGAKKITDKSLVLIEEGKPNLNPYRKDNLTPAECSVTPDDPAYIIYTSGTTGKPKGVVLPHRSVCTLIKAEEKLFALTPEDRVFQGFSLAFDASVEEIWLAWNSGALLRVGTQAEVLLGPDLADLLHSEKITVYSTVPTQIAMMENPIPSVRLLILGGEECHQKSIAPWIDGIRLVYNTYGPTETTVIATSAQCFLGVKPSIGRPVSNYSTFIVDARQNLMPLGAAGELCIGGHGLADGYLNRPELTAEKFIIPPFAASHPLAARVYRSGDLVRYLPNGRIDFAGRIDTQVKLRGHRIELSEIESNLLMMPEIETAVCTIHTDSAVMEMLVAYVVVKKNTSLEETVVRDRLKSQLQEYMVPGIFQFLPSLPVLPSGKVDRKTLPAPSSGTTGPKTQFIAPRNSYERMLTEIWKKYFPHLELSMDADFFALGGHSLLVAGVVSNMRKISGLEKTPLKVIYDFPTLESLARYAETQIKTAAKTAAKIEAEGKDQSLAQSSMLSGSTPSGSTLSGSTLGGSTLPESTPFWKRLLCGTGQMVLLYPLFSLLALPFTFLFTIDWIIPAVESTLWLQIFLMSLILFYPASLIMAVLAKWILLGRIKAGEYPLWGWFYLRFWLYSRILDLTPLRLMRGTPAMVWFCRLMGARIGSNVFINTDRFRVFDLVSISDRATLNSDAHLMCFSASAGMLRLAPISIGAHATIGTRSMVCEGTQIGAGAELGAQSSLPPNASIPAGAYFEGAPGRIAERPEQKATDLSPTRSIAYRMAYHTLFALAMISVAIAPIVLLIPWIYSAFELYVYFGPFLTLLVTPFLAASYIVLFCLMVVVVKWLCVGREKAGSIAINGFEYIGKWSSDTLIQMSLMIVQPLYATLFLPLWLRMLGAKIGQRAEISTVDHISADLLHLGNEGFVADSVSLGPPYATGGMLYTGLVTIGNRTFIGNSALIPSGTTLGSGCLIGVLSIPPGPKEIEGVNDTSWLGSPPMKLPARQQSQTFDESDTFHPSPSRIFARGTIEILRIISPLSLMSMLYVLAYWLLSEVIADYVSILGFVLISPLVFMGLAVSAGLLTIVAKWVLVGKYKPEETPLWSLLVWKSEWVNALVENLAYPLLLQPLLGTWLLPIFFKALGCRMGKGIFMESTEFTEFDLIRIDDEACLNYGCTIQTHLFEDRVMKMSSLHIGARASVGPGSVVLYDSYMHADSHLGAFSLLMKAEELPSHTAWQGVPSSSV